MSKYKIEKKKKELIKRIKNIQESISELNPKNILSKAGVSVDYQKLHSPMGFSADRTGLASTALLLVYLRTNCSYKELFDGNSFHEEKRKAFEEVKKAMLVDTVENRKFMAETLVSGLAKMDKEYVQIGKTVDFTKPDFIYTDDYRYIHSFYYLIHDCAQECDHIKDEVMEEGHNQGFVFNDYRELHDQLFDYDPASDVFFTHNELMNELVKMGESKATVKDTFLKHAVGNMLADQALEKGHVGKPEYEKLKGSIQDVELDETVKTGIEEISDEQILANVEDLMSGKILQGIHITRDDKIVHLDKLPDFNANYEKVLADTEIDTPLDTKYDLIYDNPSLTEKQKEEIYAVYEAADLLANSVIVHDVDKDTYGEMAADILTAAVIKKNVEEGTFISVQECREYAVKATNFDEFNLNGDKIYFEMAQESYQNGKEADSLKVFENNNSEREYLSSIVTDSYRRVANAGPSIEIDFEERSLLSLSYDELVEYQDEIKGEAQPGMTSKLSLLFAEARRKDELKGLLQNSDVLEKVDDNILEELLENTFLNNLNHNHPVYKKVMNWDQGSFVKDEDLADYNRRLEIQKSALRESKFIKNGIYGKSVREKLAFLKLMIKADQMEVDVKNPSGLFLQANVPTLSQAKAKILMQDYEEKCKRRNGPTLITEQDLIDDFKYSYLSNPKNNGTTLVEDDSRFTAEMKSVLQSRLRSSGSAYALRHMYRTPKDGLNEAEDILKWLGKLQLKYLHESITSKSLLNGLDIPAPGSVERENFLYEHMLQPLIDQMEKNRIEALDLRNPSQIIEDDLLSETDVLGAKDHTEEFRRVNPVAYQRLIDSITPRYQQEIMGDYEAEKLLPSGQEAIRKAFLEAFRKSDDYSVLMNCGEHDLRTEITLAEKKPISDAFKKIAKENFEGARKLYEKTHKLEERYYDDILGDSIKTYAREFRTCQAIERVNPISLKERVEAADPWYHGSSRQFDDFKAKAVACMDFYHRAMNSFDANSRPSQENLEEFKTKSQELLLAAKAYMDHKDQQKKSDQDTLEGIGKTRYDLAQKMSDFVKMRVARVDLLNERERVAQAEETARIQQQVRQANVAFFDTATAELSARIDRLENVSDEARSFIEDAMQARGRMSELMMTENHFRYQDVKEDIAKSIALISVVNQLEVEPEKLIIPDELAIKRFADMSELSIGGSDVTNLVNYLADESGRVQDGNFMTSRQLFDLNLEALDEKFLGGEKLPDMVENRKECLNVLEERKPQLKEGQPLRKAMSNEEKNVVDTLDSRINFATALENFKHSVEQVRQNPETQINAKDAATVYLYSRFQNEADFAYLFKPDVDTSISNGYIGRAHRIMGEMVDALSKNPDFHALLQEKNPVQLEDNMRRLIQGDASLGFEKRDFTINYGEDILKNLNRTLTGNVSKYQANPYNYQLPKNYGDTVIRYILLKDALKDGKTYEGLEDLEYQVALQLSNPDPEFQKVCEYLVARGNEPMSPGEIDLVVDAARKPSSKEQLLDDEREIERLNQISEMKKDSGAKLESLGSRPNMSEDFDKKEEYDALVYDNKYNLPEDLVKAVTLGAMLNPEDLLKVEKLNTLGSSDVEGHQFFIHHHIVPGHRGTKNRDVHLADHILEARKKAMIALDEYGKGNKELVENYLDIMIDAEEKLAFSYSEEREVSKDKETFKLADRIRPYSKNHREAKVYDLGAMKLKATIHASELFDSNIQLRKDLIQGKTIANSPARQEIVEKLFVAEMINSMGSARALYLANEYSHARDFKYPELQDESLFLNGTDNLYTADIATVDDAMLTSKLTKFDTIMMHDDYLETMTNVLRPYIHEHSEYKKFLSCDAKDLGGLLHNFNLEDEGLEGFEITEKSQDFPEIRSDDYEDRVSGLNSLMDQRLKDIEATNIAMNNTCADMKKLLANVTPFYLQKQSDDFINLRNGINALDRFLKENMEDYENVDEALAGNLMDKKRLEYIEDLENIIEDADKYLESKGENPQGLTKKRVNAVLKVKKFCEGRRKEALLTSFKKKTDKEYSQEFNGISKSILEDDDLNAQLKVHSKEIDKTLKRGQRAKIILGKYLIGGDLMKNPDRQYMMRMYAKEVFTANLVRNIVANHLA